MAINTSMKPKHQTTQTQNGNVGGGGEDDSGGSSRSPSPPPSPPTLNRQLSQCRRRLRTTKSGDQSNFLRRENLAAGILLRRDVRYMVVVVLVVYVSGLVVCAGPVWGFWGKYYYTGRMPSAVYRSHEVFKRLWVDIDGDRNSTSLQLSSVWNHKRRIKVPKPCPNSTAVHTESYGPSGYLIVEANGGLNQQRSAICNAVALAGLLNAVLVIPYFEFNNVWRDPSEFSDIYDLDHFIATLEGYVKVVQKVPDELMETYGNNITNITSFRVPAWASAKHYLQEVYPVLREQGVIRIAPFANRLSMHVPPQIQLLRCIANYKALRFSSPIETLAQKLIARMIEKSSRNGGKYVSVHLRFEEDMVAFSCCVYDGGDAEKSEMDSIRAKAWKGKFKRKDRVILPGYNRFSGKCPLTPLEVGMLLRGMGFDNNTSIYLASGKIYQADRHLAPLMKVFPLLYTKESLASPEELAQFASYSSRMAALDYTVCLHSEVFVTTQGGNFPHFLMGHRRFLFDGHAKTIKPDKQKLVLLLQDMEISWTAFKDAMKIMLTENDRKSILVPRVKKFNRKTSIYMHPLPECGCLLSRGLSMQSNSTFNALESRIESVR